MALKPVGSGISFATSGSAQASSFISHQSEYIRVVAIDKNAHVAVGTAPSATTTDLVVITGEPEILTIGRPSSQRVVAITTGTTTIIDFPEGTGSPFVQDDIVSLSINGSTSQTQGNLEYAYINALTNVGVLAVNNTAGFSGFHNTRITLNANTSGIATAFNFQYAELRDDFKVSAEAIGGTGMFYAQQIQTAGGPS
tara:strand:- start:114 stop:704 length:591 start_codon:yes stop_codon:yes gene_type:complete